jgi:hypothetical protein
LSIDLYNIVSSHITIDNLLNNVMCTYENIYKKCFQRILYYAYTQEEVDFFKRKYNAPIFFIEMDHVLRTNILAVTDENKLNKAFDQIHVNTIENMKNKSNYVIKNDFTFDSELINKVTFAMFHD